VAPTGSPEDPTGATDAPTDPVVQAVGLGKDYGDFRAVE
jgi:hypothetical protein